MAKRAPRRGLERQIADLRAVREAPEGPGARDVLTAALARWGAPAVALAATIIDEAELSGFGPALAAAFERFLEDPVKRDPGCAAKAGVVRALYRLDEPAVDLFLRGVRYVQREPAYPEAQDTAAEVRGLCALALVRCEHPEALVEAADLLADPEPAARVAAAQAVAYSERADVGVPLLWFKARLGDAEPRVAHACFAGLLSLSPERALPFVTAVARGRDAEVREAALLALGESRLPGAFVALRELVEDVLDMGSNDIAYMAIGLIRSDPAWDYLLSVMREGPEVRARAALDALAAYRADAGLRERMLAAVRSRKDSSDLRAYAERILDA